MRTPEDDLKVGQWVAISDEIVADTPDGACWHSFGMPMPQRASNVDGRPLKIVALSLPFIAVTDGENRYPLDVRETKVIRLSPSYVKAMSSRCHPPANRYVINEKCDSVIYVPDARTCPSCGDRLRERFAQGLWIFACRACGFEGRRPGVDAPPQT